MKPKEIIHLDMDAFYASVEVLDAPALHGRPVVVGGCSDRGVVSAASYEARHYGIHSAMPMVTARRLCPQGIFLPVRMARYQEISTRIMAIFRHYTPLVEPISLDEAFLDVTGSVPLFGPAAEIARTIKSRVRTETGLTVSAGVASSKLVAKIASDLQKPNGLTIVATGREQEFLAPLPIGRLWGVGQATRKALALLGVKTIGDLSRLPPELLARKFGKHGPQMHQAARGIDSRAVEPEREMKSIGREETFEQDLLRSRELERELLDLSMRVGHRLRRYGLTGKTITLKVKYHDFQQITRSLTLATPTDDGKLVFERAEQLLLKTEAGRKPIRLLGISLSNLAPAGQGQLSLFAAPCGGAAKRRELNVALDRISEKYGAGAIRPAPLFHAPREDAE